MPTHIQSYRDKIGKFHNDITKKNHNNVVTASRESQADSMPAEFISHVSHAWNSPAVRQLYPALANPRSNTAANIIRMLLLFNQLRPEIFISSTGGTTSPAVSNYPEPAMSTSIPLIHDIVQTIPARPAARNPNPDQPFIMAGAEAAPLDSDNTGIQKDNTNNYYVVNNELKINEVIAKIKDFLIATEQVSEEEANDYELELRAASAGTPLLIIPLDPPSTGNKRVRRVVEDQHNPDIAQHIKENCAIEQEILNADGENKGKILILRAQRAENPFRTIYEGKDTQPTPEERGVADGLQIATGIITFGVMPLIGNLMAASYRKQYYEQSGDAICTERQKRLMFAEVSTAVDASALPFNQRGKPPVIKPHQFANVKKTDNGAAYYLRDKYRGIRKEILLELKKGNGAITEGEKKILLKPTDKENEFVTYHPQAVNPKQQERLVVIDPQSNTWRYADRFDTSRINVEIREGDSYIDIYGGAYKLIKNAGDTFSIALPKEAGVVEYLPVYMEPLSKRWHLTTHYSKPAFTPAQKKIVDQFKQQVHHDFTYYAEAANNQKYYGSAITFRAEKTADDSHYVYARYIELNGELVPVREKVTPEHGVRYEIYDIKAPDKKAYSVEWSGERWLFEPSTSARVSAELKKELTPDMFFKDADASVMSAPDSNGIRWDNDGNKYLKVDDKFLKIKESGFFRYSIPSPKSQRDMVIRLKNGKFYKETTRERLKNITAVGFGGRKRPSPIDMLKDIDGFTEESARDFLANHNFPNNSVYNVEAAILYAKEHGEFPYWTALYKTRRTVQSSAEAIETVIVKDFRFPELDLTFRLGKEQGDGRLKNVFIDAEDDAFIIKKYPNDKSTAPVTRAIQEAEEFVNYYGKGSAQLFADKDGNYYVRMYKTPGSTIDSTPNTDFPADAGDRFLDMIEQLNIADISQNSLRAENVLWDKTSKSFYPTYSMKQQTPDLQIATHSDKKNNPIDLLEKVLQEIELKAKSHHENSNSENGLAAVSSDTKKSIADSAPHVKTASSWYKDTLTFNLKHTQLDELIKIKTPLYDRVGESLAHTYQLISVNSNRAHQRLQIARYKQVCTSVKKAIQDLMDPEQLFNLLEKTTTEIINPESAVHKVGDSLFHYEAMGRNDVIFRIKTTIEGSESKKLLYPEDKLVDLQQAELDATAYEKAVASLTPDEKAALRTWTGLTNEAGKVYSDNTLSDGSNVNFRLNDDLRLDKTLNQALQKQYDAMMSALSHDKLPTQPGDYIRTLEYGAQMHNPWLAGEISPGDYVTNAKGFMSVSSDTAFAETFTRKLALPYKAIINYKIITDKGPAPLLQKALSLSTFENEYLYKPDTVFVVKEYSTSEPLPPIGLTQQAPARKPASRISVILKEIDMRSQHEDYIAKDLFTGEQRIIPALKTPEEQV